MGNELNLTELRGRVSGPVFMSGDEGVAEEVACFNQAIHHSPDLVIGATSADDVAEAVRFAAANDLEVSVQATGHTESAITSGLLLTTRRMDGFAVDPVEKTVNAGAGVKWQPVVEAAAEHGLAPIAGSSPMVIVPVSGASRPASRVNWAARMRWRWPAARWAPGWRCVRWASGRATR